jgi:acyl-CoA dehydrogenase
VAHPPTAAFGERSTFDAGADDQPIEELTALVREFVDREAIPRDTQIEDDDRIPDELLQGARQLGLFGLSIPEAYGGLGLSMAGKCRVLEELGRAHNGFTSVIGAHNGIGSMGVVQIGSDEQRARYLPRLASGEIITSYALTEPQAGSDPTAIETCAERRGDRWLLNGQKVFITNAAIAGMFTVIAVTDRQKGARGGFSVFLVERDSPGLTVGPADHKMGLRGSSTATLIFDNCEVPAENLLGGEGRGYGAAMRILADGRVGLAARCAGACQRLLELAVAYARERRQGGRPIGEYQLVQAHLAWMETETQAMRALARRVATQLDQGSASPRETSAAKLFCTEAFGRVADRAVQVYGGMGYIRDNPVEHFYRDARITRLYEGTSEIQQLIIARELLRDQAS